MVRQPLRGSGGTKQGRSLVEGAGVEFGMYTFLAYRWAYTPLFI